MLIQNKLIVRRLFEELFNEGELTVIDELVAPTYCNHSAAAGERPGREGLKQGIEQFHAAFQDLYCVIEGQLAEGNQVATWWTATGLQRAAFAGIPATGKRRTITAITIHQVVDGQIQESWLNWTIMPMLGPLTCLSAEKPLA